VAYVRSRPAGPLFDGLKAYQGRRAKDASNRLNAWLHDVDVVGLAKEKSFHWMRHTVKSAYEAAWLPDRLNDYLLGHSVQAVAAVYLHRELEDLQRAVELVTVPGRQTDIAA
jgi:integrase